MKGLDDGPDGLNEKAFDRALGAKSKRKTPAPKSLAQLEREYERALAAEHKAVAAVPETPPRHTPTPAAKAAADRAWAAAEKTNAARKALSAARDAADNATTRSKAATP